MEVEELIIKGAPMSKNGTVTITKVPLNKIKLSRNSRLNVDPEELEGLMQSIKEEGLLQPIGVIKNNGGYEICYGNRRFLAVSKLGLHSIPAIVHEKKKEFDVDIKNLTENIQRRNISLAEAGRYIELLKAQGLTSKECAIRLGVTDSYVNSCLVSYNEIPEEFQKDIEIRSLTNSGTNTPARPGKISVRTARTIISLGKSYKISMKEKKDLLRAAKNDSRFRTDLIPKYIEAISTGSKDFLEEVKPQKRINLCFYIAEDQYKSLYKKHVENGHYKSVTMFLYDVLEGKKSEKINLTRKMF